MWNMDVIYVVCGYGYCLYVVDDRLDGCMESAGLLVVRMFVGC